MFTCSVNTDGIEKMCRELAGLAGVNYEKALASQVGAVLKNCIRNTAAASRENIIKRASAGQGYVEFADGTVISTWKKANHSEMFLAPSTWNGRGKPPHLIGGMSWHNMTDYHWCNATWQNFLAHQAQAKAAWAAGTGRGKNGKLAAPVQSALQARGLAKRSWVQIAEMLGIDISALGAPGYVLAAHPSNGQHYQNGTAHKMIEDAKFVIEIRNDSPLLTHFRHPTGPQILQRAIDSRLKAFRHDMAHDVFEDIARRARRYPGIFVSPPT